MKTNIGEISLKNVIIDPHTAYLVCSLMTETNLKLFAQKLYNSYNWDGNRQCKEVLNIVLDVVHNYDKEYFPEYICPA